MTALGALPFFALLLAGLRFAPSFGADMPLLPDCSYYSAYNRSYAYSVVENDCER